MQSYTFLFAAIAVSAAEIPTCGCHAESLGFTIDCTKPSVIQAAYDFCEATCLKDCSSAECKKNFAIVEAHHDFCLHDQVPIKVEVGFHDLEEVCAKECTIGRLKDADHTACPSMACPDEAGVAAVVKTLADNKCDVSCPEATCGEAFRKLRVIHDTCEETDDKAFEWAGVFSIAESSHTWLMQKKSGKYADPTMKVVFIPTGTPTKAEMESLENKGSNLLLGSCQKKIHQEVMKPAAGGSCFDLNVDTTLDDTRFTIDTTGITGLAIYAQHVPTEFERDTHYLLDPTGTAVEPAAQESTGGHHDHDHGRRLVDVDAALHTYEDKCDAVACYVEVAACSAGTADLSQLATLKDRAAKKCHITAEEAICCPGGKNKCPVMSAVEDSSGVMAGMMLMLMSTISLH
jgi:hypothetical protein